MSPTETLRKQLTHVHESAKEFVDKVFTRKKRTMFLYPLMDLKGGWSLDDVYQRTLAAQELGWCVTVHADAAGLRFDYEEKLPARPWNL